jgi:hypothetical protein
MRVNVREVRTPRPHPAKLGDEILAVAGLRLAVRRCDRFTYQRGHRRAASVALSGEQVGRGFVQKQLRSLHHLGV